MVDDQIGTPTYTFDLGAAALRYDCDGEIRRLPRHQRGICSWADFAEAVFAGAGCKTR